MEGGEATMTTDPLRSYDLNADMTPDLEARADAIIAACNAVFAGQHPSVQGLALAEMLATWIAGHQLPEAVHEVLLAFHTEKVRSLLPLARERVDGILRRMGGRA
jgi:hypothetical protein